MFYASFTSPASPELAMPISSELAMAIIQGRRILAM
jgi:hypothetical protein